MKQPMLWYFAMPMRLSVEIFSALGGQRIDEHTYEIQGPRYKAGAGWDGNAQDWYFFRMDGDKEDGHVDGWELEEALAWAYRYACVEPAGVQFYLELVEKDKAEPEVLMEV